MALNTINPNLNITMSYEGTQKGAIAPYSLAEHRYFIREPENFGNKQIVYLANYDKKNFNTIGNIQSITGRYSSPVPYVDIENTFSGFTDIKIYNSKYYTPFGEIIEFDLSFPLPPGTITLPSWTIAVSDLTSSNRTIYNLLDNTINKILINSSYIYAVGAYTNSYNTNIVTNINPISPSKTSLKRIGRANINGTSWTDLSGGLNDEAKDLIILNDNLYVVGKFTAMGTSAKEALRIAKWNISNSSWSELSGGLSSNANCITTNGTDLFIGGVFITGSSSLGGNIALNNIAKWNISSKTWSSLGNGVNGEIKSIYFDNSANRLYVGGDFTTASYSSTDVEMSKIGYWDFNNSTWNNLSDGIIDSSVLGINKLNEEIYFVGTFSNFTASNGNVYGIKGVAKFDGNKISLVGDGLNNSVYGLDVSNENIYIVGNFTSTFYGQRTITTKDIFKPLDAANYGNPRLAPRLQYVFNNHLPSSTGSTINGGMKLFDLDPENPLVPLKTYEQYPESIFVLNDAYVYETDKLSGKKPFFNSYEEYFEDLKPLSQKYSIIPEFRMDNVIEYFIKEKNADFNAGLTSSYLSLDSNINYLDDINSTINSSNEIKTFAQDVNSNVSGTTFSISISGLKKLLPYNGFYPQQRVSQLADKFINSLIDSTDTYLSSDNVEYDTNLSNGTPRDQQILTLLQPLFAPGILMNTIKSSIAVDWPTFIGNYGTYSSGNLNGVPSFYRNIRNGGFGITNYTASYVLSAQKFDFRFPFESLLEFDTIIPSSFKKGNNNLYYLDPTYYSTDVVSGSDRNNLRYPSYNLSSGSLKKLIFKDNLYKLGMHNFLAEIPNFFLQNGLNNFISEPIQKVVPVSGTAYVIDVVLDRDQNKYKEFIQHPLYESLRNNNENYISGVYLPPSTDSLYGPPCEWVRDVSGVPLEQYGIANFTLKFVDSPAYAPYVAPYYYGKSVARIVFLPNETREYALDEILQNASSGSYYINKEAEELFALKGGFLGAGYSYLAYKELMQLSSSVNLFSKTEIKNTVIDAATGIATEVADSVNPKYSWVIQTKFETPSINFAKMNDYNNLGMNFLGGTKTSYVEGIYSNLYKGLWTSYGEPVKNGEGIKMYLEYDKDISLSDIPGAKDIKPLTNLIEFGGLASQEQKTIGLLANKKKIQEAIIVIPYVTKPLTSEYPSLIEPIYGENGVYTSVAPVDIPKYFAIDKAKISEVLGLPFDSSALSFEQIKKQVNSNKVNPNNSIIKTIKAMTEFVIPPHLNWIKNRSIEPFVMYVFPFSTELDTEDLSDIWQGLMPKASRNVKEEEIVISHSLKENEMFHGKKLPEGMKFKIFKAKQQANINYYKLTADSKDDKNFKFKFGNSGEAKIPEYSYNWPYDYFSLVELVNIKASLEVESPSIKLSGSA